MDPMATDLDGCLDDFLSAWHRSSVRADLGPHVRRIKDTVGIRFVGLALLSLMLHPDGWLKQAHSETKGQGSPFIHYATADRATFFVGTILESSATADGQFLHRVRVEASAQPRRDREISIIGGRLPEAGTFLLPLTIEAGQWTLMAPLTRAHELGSREAPSAIKALLRWQNESEAPVLKRLDSWLSWTTHPVLFVRHPQSPQVPPRRARFGHDSIACGRFDRRVRKAETSADERRTLLSLVALSEAVQVPTGSPVVCIPIFPPTKNTSSTYSWTGRHTAFPDNTSKVASESTGTASLPPTVYGP